MQCTHAALIPSSPSYEPCLSADAVGAVGQGHTGEPRWWRWWRCHEKSCDLRQQNMLRGPGR